MKTLQPIRRKQVRRIGALVSRRPRNEAQLAAWVEAVFGLRVPREAIVQGSDSPLKYLSHAFFEDGRDAVVWAPRGGGKTMLGAVATVLDLLFKPGVQVRILGGSLEQSSRMYEYVLQLLDRPVLRGVLSGSPTQRCVETRTGSRAAILSQSQRSVRGVRVQKLRCDEVELFDPRVWEAAQLVTRSAVCAGRDVQGTVEALSTMHRPSGLMSRLVAQGNSCVMKWTAMDVIEQCEPDRACEGCALWDDCGGRAKQAAGFVPIDDLIRQRKRSSHATWASEMMCERPVVHDRVYDGFDAIQHVRAAVDAKDKPTLACGMDFGWRSPTVVLWAQVYGCGDDAIIHVIDERARSRTMLDEHIQAIKDFKLGEPAWIGIDPAGGAGNAQTGLSDLQQMRRAGLRVRAARSMIRDGVELLRAKLDHHKLFIHPRCTGLIEAMQHYHFDEDRPTAEEPVKDGPDHYCDALRYLAINLGRDDKVHRRRYL